ncbi:hypothetical protein LZ554_002146 [Drepanopeziza brunnea f. sp. 'monogermtubi']|nr:hypothetical protein LZ554_002146 [Drepanopeziza brunnea f. sp. 'monogermtubi']
MAVLRPRSVIFAGLTLFLLLFVTFTHRSGLSVSLAPVSLELGTPTLPPTPPPPPPPSGPSPTKYRHKPERVYDQPPVVDNFPVAAAAHSAADLPPIPPWNTPPNPHVAENTPLLIGFTRNWLLLQQTVVSYITAGWPPEDIYVVENTGTMQSNQRGLLGLQNPFFLNYTRLGMLGVNVVPTPTLFTFAQMQNFFLYTAIERKWASYFWGHMDVVVLPFEENYSTSHEGENSGYKSLYVLAVEGLRNATSGHDIHSTDPSKTWALRFFSYDRLALVNTAAFEAVGGWDAAIPYYNTDCDMHERLKMHGFELGDGDVPAGRVFDVADSMDDLIYLYRTAGVEPSFVFKGQAEEEEQEAEKEKQAAGEEASRLMAATKAAATPVLRARDKETARKWVSDTANSPTFAQLRTIVQKMEKHKAHFGGGGRLYWQVRQHGGQREPYYRDPDGFQRAIELMHDLGRDVYAEKWGHRECNLLDVGRKKGDEWRIEKDWE